MEAHLAMYSLVEWLQICMIKCALDELFWQSLHYWCLRITTRKDGAHLFFLYTTLLFHLSDLETKNYQAVFLATCCTIIQIVLAFFPLFVNVHHAQHFSGDSFPTTTSKQACRFINWGAQETGINELTKELSSKKIWYVVSKKEQKSLEVFSEWDFFDAEHHYFSYYISGESSPIIFLFIFN